MRISRKVIFILISMFGLIVLFQNCQRAKYGILNELSSKGLTSLYLSANWGHTCVVTKDSKVKCWGKNGYGELGNGLSEDSAIPVDVQNLSNVVQLSGEYMQSCALKDDGFIFCWGRNSHPYGVNTTNSTKSLLPIIVPGSENSQFVIGVATDAVCFLSLLGSVKCWGNDVYTPGILGNGAAGSSMIPGAVVNLSGVTKLSKACALTDQGEAYCWGPNEYGVLGDGTENTSQVPVKVQGFDGLEIVDIVRGAFHACAQVSDGSLYCWGRNSYGQLGTGVAQDTGIKTPVLVTEVTGVKQLSLGLDYSCAIGSDDLVRCWGRHDGGQLGCGDNCATVSSGHDYSVKAQLVSGLGRVRDISVGPFHACAVTINGDVKCWGGGGAGALGNGKFESTTVPVSVVGVKSFY